MVAESGFGTGLNFLTLWQAFDQFREAHPQAQLQRLHFISFEKSSPLLHFVHALSCPKRTAVAIDSLLVLGHTSGADTLLG